MDWAAGKRIAQASASSGAPVPFSAGGLTGASSAAAGNATTSAAKAPRASAPGHRERRASKDIPHCIGSPSQTVSLSRSETPQTLGALGVGLDPLDDRVGRSLGGELPPVRRRPGLAPRRRPRRCRRRGSCAQPATPWASASRRVLSRKKTPWTWPWTTTRRRIVLTGRSTAAPSATRASIVAVAQAQLPQHLAGVGAQVAAGEADRARACRRAARRGRSSDHVAHLVVLHLLEQALGPRLLVVEQVVALADGRGRGRRPRPWRRPTRRSCGPAKRGRTAPRAPPPGSRGRRGRPTAGAPAARACPSGLAEAARRAARRRRRRRSSRRRCGRRGRRRARRWGRRGRAALSTRTSEWALRATARAQDRRVDPLAAAACAPAR